MIKNSKRQELLDEQKYYASLYANRDLSGEMEYCAKCPYANGGCTASQEERVNGALCAKAYNKANFKLFGRE